MPAHIEKVIRHAESKLEKKLKKEPGQALDLYKSFLKVESHRLWLDHHAGESGTAQAMKRSNLFSVILRYLFDASLAKAKEQFDPEDLDVQISLLAIGGFGREAMCPESDIDLMFLHDPVHPKSTKSKVITEVVEHILYLLWDLGLKVGHSSRDVQEAVKQGRLDFQNTTAMMDIRLLRGSQELVDEFERRFQRLCINGHEQAFFEWRDKDQKERHAKFDNTVFVQEPHVKNGCGGLRDFHHLLWVARVAENYRSVKEIQKNGWITATEMKEINKAVDFITRIRNHLHYLSKRPTELLTLQLQGEIARDFKYPQQGILRKTEALMKEYYEHSNNLFHLANLAARRLSGYEKKSGGFFSHILPSSRKKEKSVDGFKVIDNEIQVPARQTFRKNPVKLLQVFQVAQRHDLRISADLELSLRKASRHINRTLVRKKEFRELFFDLLSQKGSVGSVIRLMHQTRILGRIVPEFAPLTCLVQHEFYHRYTADEHTIVCLEKLDQVVDSEEMPFLKYRDLMSDCKQSDILYLALILHDVGKSENSSSHAEESVQLAIRCARRFGLKGRRLALLTFLVDHHMTLHHFATQKNLEDPQTSLQFAEIVEDREKLDMLMLMSFADGQGAGDNSWSNWKEGLVWQLHRLTTQILLDDRRFVEKDLQAQEEIKASVRKKVDSVITDGEFENHFLALPPSYLDYRHEHLIVNQVNATHAFIRHRVAAVSADQYLIPEMYWDDRPAAGCSEITVVYWNGERVFAKLCGALAVLGLHILSADIWTREDNILIDTFRVCTDQKKAASNPYDKKKFKEILKKIFCDRDFDIGDHIPKVKSGERLTLGGETIRPEFGFDNQSSDQFTLFYVRAADQIGLLYHITNVIADHD
ncbi:MAG: [protein-PII] uridylyltransferase, partial [Verrucomicrobiota bacterium]